MARELDGRDTREVSSRILREIYYAEKFRHKFYVRYYTRCNIDREVSSQILHGIYYVENLNTELAPGLHDLLQVYMTCSRFTRQNIDREVSSRILHEIYNGEVSSRFTDDRT